MGGSVEHRMWPASGATTAGHLLYRRDPALFAAAWATRRRPPSDHVRVAVCDGQSLTRSALRRCLEAERCQVAYETGDITSALADLADIAPAILVVEIAKSERAARRLVADVLRQAPGMAVIALATRADVATVRGVFAAGGRAYLPKESAERELPRAVRAVIAGRMYLDPHWGAVFVSQRQRETREELTPRQKEILGLIALGLTNAETARRLSISVRTVESHRAEIQERLQRYSRASLVRYAVEHGLIEIDDSERGS